LQLLVLILQSSFGLWNCTETKQNSTLLIQVLNKADVRNLVAIRS